MCVSSDGGAIKLLVTAHKVFTTQEQAAVAALKAGINQYLDTYKDELHAALKDGSITQADLDEALRRKFRITLKLGLLDPPDQVPYRASMVARAAGRARSISAVSKAMALELIVLLKNSGRALPLANARR